jgi:hypothetical protein
MAKDLRFTCDGCGHEELMPAGDELPVSWHIARVVIDGLPAESSAYHLCDHCTKRLDPKTWRRVGAPKVRDPES